MSRSGMVSSCDCNALGCGADGDRRVYKLLNLKENDDTRRNVRVRCW